MWALSNNDSIRGSRIYNLPIEGGLPNLIIRSVGIIFISILSGPEACRFGEWTLMNPITNNYLMMDLTIGFHTPHLMVSKLCFYPIRMLQIPAGIPHLKMMPRILNLDIKIIYKLFEFFAGQRTLNVPSRSLDSKRFAFVSYALIDNKEQLFLSIDLV